MNQTHFPGNESEKNITPNNGKSKARWKIFSLAILVLLLASMNVQADTISFEIQDNYIGAAPTHLSWDGEDVIGEEEWFGIDKMVVSWNATDLFVEIYTNYVNHIGKFNTELGDLFISTDGWNPQGDEDTGYLVDKMGNGTSWNYVLAMDNHSLSELGDYDDDKLEITSGSTTLYELDNSNSNGYDSNIMQSFTHSQFSSYIFRADQEYRFTSSSSSDNGSWVINQGTDSNDSGDSFLRYQVALADLELTGGENIGLHWTMSCGNDVIEGQFTYHTPEPATMLLFGVGLIGLAGVIRKKTYN